MGIFRKSSNAKEQDHQRTPSGEMKITKEERQNLKVRTATVHDPILEAVQEAQPFEQAADTFQDNINRQSYVPTGHLVDIFGQRIQQPDISNPTRARDERPLDTIRGFEYAISGDPTWSQQLETSQYGFRVRPGFQSFAPTSNGQSQNMNMNMNMNSYQEQGVYQAPTSQGDGEERKKKKKRGLFSRKKKD